METKEEINELFIEEVEKYMYGDKLYCLPEIINVTQDELPNLKRWKTNGGNY